MPSLLVALHHQTPPTSSNARLMNTTPLTGSGGYDAGKIRKKEDLGWRILFQREPGFWNAGEGGY